MDNIFKPYDIRGVFGDTLTPDVARDIGRAFATFLAPQTVVVGKDMRPHSPELFSALADGLTQQGVDVIALPAVCSTPMCYYATGKLGAQGGIMITASHNTGEWNGFKLCREQAIPISGATGIADIERLVRARSFAAPPQRRGTITEQDIAPAYREHLHAQVRIEKRLRIAADFANAVGVVEARSLEGLLEVDPLFPELDGTFPHHEANPLKAETLDALRARVGSGGYAFGVAFDGDADRVGFVDEQGGIIPMDAITALIGQALLAREQGVILVDLRSSWATREALREAGAEVRLSRVGHAFIKQQMRDAKALFAGELSGHYYFRENYYTESSALAVLHVAALVAHSGKRLSELIAPLRRYAASGEINSRVADPAAVLQRLKEHYSDGRLLELDGLSVEYPDWWFNVRASNTEPLVRLNLEARTRAAMEQHREEVLQWIRG